MTTDNITISRAALGKIVGALDQAKRWHQGDKWRDNSTIEERAAWEDHLITLDAALTEARAAMDAQGEAEYFGLEPWERPANVPVATMIFPKHSPTKPFVALGDCAKFYPDAAQCKPLYTNPQATEPAQSSNPSGEHSEPSLLGSEPAPSTAGERSELLKALSENRLHYSDQSTLAALLQSTALPVGELTDKIISLPTPASASDLKSDIVELIQSHKYKGLRSIEVLGVFQFLGAEIISGSNS